MKRPFTPSLMFLLAACSGSPDSGPLRIDAIGEIPNMTNPVAALPSYPHELLLQATAQGLVGRDAEGRIEPALAKRWIVLDEGRTYIFRLNDLRWNDGTALTAGQIARQLRTASRPDSRNRLARLLADIDEVNAVTPQIIEIILNRPRIDFLQLLAEPDMALYVDGSGLGPFEITETDSSEDEVVHIALRPDLEEDSMEIDGAAEPLLPDGLVDLRFRPASVAVARFDAGLTDLVLNGRWTTLVLALAIDPPNARLQIDEVEGLFGLAIVEDSGFLAEPDNREVLSLAIDRSQLAGYFGIEQAEERLSLVPPGSQGLGEAPVPPWAETTMGLRRGFAIEAVRQWRANNGEVPVLRIALPDGPGSNILFAVIRTNWAVVGIETIRVGWTEDADLRLIDRVAATGHATWYLEQFRCGTGLPCSDTYEDAMTAIEVAATPRVRGIRIAEAAAELQSLTPFIPLLRPIRWSLVSQRVPGFAPNRFASHPFDRLLGPSS